MEQSQTMEKLQQEVDLYINGFKEGYFPRWNWLPG